jgi:hypothetical protein
MTALCHANELYDALRDLSTALGATTTTTSGSKSPPAALPRATTQPPAPEAAPAPAVEQGQDPAPEAAPAPAVEQGQDPAPEAAPAPAPAPAPAVDQGQDPAPAPAPAPAVDQGQNRDPSKQGLLWRTLLWPFGKSGPKDSSAGGGGRGVLTISETITSASAPTDPTQATEVQGLVPHALRQYWDVRSSQEVDIEELPREDTSLHHETMKYIMHNAKKDINMIFLCHVDSHYQYTFDKGRNDTNGLYSDDRFLSRDDGIWATPNALIFYRLDLTKREFFREGETYDEWAQTLLNFMTSGDPITLFPDATWLLVWNSLRDILIVRKKEDQFHFFVRHLVVTLIPKGAALKGHRRFVCRYMISYLTRVMLPMKAKPDKDFEERPCTKDEYDFLLETQMECMNYHNMYVQSLDVRELIQMYSTYAIHLDSELDTQTAHGTFIKHVMKIVNDQRDLLRMFWTVVKCIHNRQKYTGRRVATMSQEYFTKLLTLIRDNYFPIDFISADLRPLKNQMKDFLATVSNELTEKQYVELGNVFTGVTIYVTKSIDEVDLNHFSQVRLNETYRERRQSEWRQSGVHRLPDIWQRDEGRPILDPVLSEVLRDIANGAEEVAHRRAYEASMLSTGAPGLGPTPKSPNGFLVSIILAIVIGYSSS